MSLSQEVPIKELLSHRMGVLRDVAALWGGVFVTQILGFALAIYTRRILAPEAMGIWAFFQVFLGYASHAGFVYEGAFREIPLLRGRGDFERSRQIGNVAFTLIFWISVVISAASLVYLAAAHSTLTAPYAWGIVTFAVLNILMRWNNFSIGYLYAEREFVFSSKLKIVSAVANAIFMMVLVARYGLYGFYAAMVASIGFNLLYIFACGKMPYRFEWNAEVFKPLAVSSLLLTIVGFAHTALVSMDRLAVGRFLGMASLGSYALASLGSGYLLMFAYMFNAVFYPRMLERYGQSGQSESLRRYQRLPAILLSTYLPIAIGAVWACGPWLVQTFLPKYVEGLDSLVLLMIGTVFLTLINQQGQVLLALGRQSKMILGYSSVAIAAGMVYFFMGRLGAPMQYFAAVSTISLSIVYAIQLAVVSDDFSDAFTVLKHFIRTIIPSAVVYICYIAMEAYWPQRTFSNVWCRLVFFLPTAVVLAVWAERDLNLRALLVQAASHMARKK